jgi:sugar transferase EpsL
VKAIVAKRACDVLGASLALLLAAVPMAVAALAVRVTMGHPVLFTQQRPGLYGRAFLMYKFRTMTEARDEQGALLPDEARITRLGAFLRAASIDELPELINVVRGDMSLVGPRPLRMEYLERYSPRQARRHEVKPGITGLAQVEGRNASSWEERLEQDVWYVDHWSIALDLRLLARTARAVLTRRGISHTGHSTMPEFRGQGE